MQKSLYGGRISRGKPQKKGKVHATKAIHEEKGMEVKTSLTEGEMNVDKID